VPWFRISEQSAKMGMAAYAEWFDATVRKNPQLSQRDVEVFGDFANRGFEAAWKFRDMVDDIGFEAAMAKLKAEARGEVGG
jgi:hypothetical protein